MDNTSIQYYKDRIILLVEDRLAEEPIQPLLGELLKFKEFLQLEDSETKYAHLDFETYKLISTPIIKFCSDEKFNEALDEIIEEMWENPSIPNEVRKKAGRPKKI